MVEWLFCLDRLWGDSCTRGGGWCSDQLWGAGKGIVSNLQFASVSARDAEVRAFPCTGFCNLAGKGLKQHVARL